MKIILSPAILAYDGIAFQYMAPAAFEAGMFSYVQEHLRILSGFYGVLKPMDGVVPYRLEMQAKAITLSPVPLRKKKRENLSRRAFTARWLAGKWCDLWQRTE